MRMHVGGTSPCDECLDDRPPAEGHIPGVTASGPDRRPAPALAAAPSRAIDAGEPLRQARAAHGVSLDDLSRITKIPRDTLVAIEACEVAHLPAAVYTRGFVKAYAREVGLDPDAAANEYLARIEPLARRDEVSVGLGRTEPDANPEDARQRLAGQQLQRFNRLALVGAVIGLVVYVASFGRAGRDTAELVPLPVPAETDPAAGVESAGGIVHASLPADMDVQHAVATLRPFSIELVTQGPCWLSASVDGERVVYKLLQPGERQTLAMSEELILRVGDPGALSLSINGEVGRPLGPAGRPVDIRITRDNFKEFLSS